MTNKRIYGRVYLITNTVNGKVYIGQTVRSLKERWSQHKATARQGSIKPLYRSIRKHGSSRFTIVEIEVLKSKATLNKAEKYWIEYYQSTDKKFGYNLTFGGEGGKRTEEVRRKNILRNGGLTEKQELEVIRLYRSKKVKPDQIAARFNLHKTIIYRMFKRRGISTLSLEKPNKLAA